MTAKELNIIDDINRCNINGKVPNTAEYAMLNPSGDFIQKFYKFEKVNFNDGTTKDILKYKGEQGGWHTSSYNATDFEKLKNNKFLKIIN